MIFYRCFGLLITILSVHFSSANNAYGCATLTTPCIYTQKDTWVDYIEPTYPVAPHPIASDSWQNSSATIFLAIASYRDKLCPITLFNLFTKAKYPNRIHVGVVQQNVASDVDCLLEYCRLIKESKRTEQCLFEQNIRMMRVDAAKAKGPVWARALGSTLLRDEEFCMQTDAHMDFVPDWDVKMLKMWASTNNEYAILSTYVAPVEQLKDNTDDHKKGLNGVHEVPHLCMVTLHGANGLCRVWGTKCARNLPKPKLTNGVWGAGLSFSKCHAERKSPYDPHTPHIFDGEEFSRAIRFWTWGYDIYTPNRVYVLHDYSKSQADPVHSNWAFNAASPGEESEGDAVKRLKMLHGIPTGDSELDANPLSPEHEALRRSRYGLGDRRSLLQFIEFSGIDTIRQIIASNRCGNIDYVPFMEHPWGADYIPQYDEKTEQFIDVRDPNSIYFDSERLADWAQADNLHWAKKRAAGSAGSNGVAGEAGVTAMRLPAAGPVDVVPPSDAENGPKVFTESGSDSKHSYRVHAVDHSAAGETTRKITKEQEQQQAKVGLLGGHDDVSVPLGDITGIISRSHSSLSDVTLMILVGVFIVAAICFVHIRRYCHVGKDYRYYHSVSAKPSGQLGSAIKTV